MTRIYKILTKSIHNKLTLKNKIKSNQNQYVHKNILYMVQNLFIIFVIKNKIKSIWWCEYIRYYLKSIYNNILEEIFISKLIWGFLKMDEIEVIFNILNKQIKSLTC